jgi:hypothetical protein
MRSLVLISEQMEVDLAAGLVARRAAGWYLARLPLVRLHAVGLKTDRGALIDRSLLIRHETIKLRETMRMAPPAPGCGVLPGTMLAVPLELADQVLFCNGT